jgi:hypothetical protein
MDNPTFRSRIAALMQKSRRALRLYTSVGRTSGEVQHEFGERQAHEWKLANLELLKRLSEAMEHANVKLAVRDVFAAREVFYTMWRDAEAEVAPRQRDLVFAAENGDFIRAAIIGGELVGLKARAQASQAAHHELDDLIRQSRLAYPTMELPLPAPDATKEAPLAKVIPLLKEGVPRVSGGSPHAEAARSAFGSLPSV